MILARHAEALFWSGRQLERAEHTTRVLDIASRDSMHFSVASTPPEWQLILQVLSLEQLFAETGRIPDGIQVCEFLFVDDGNAGSVSASVAQLRENIRTVRDRVPVELWEETNRLHLALVELQGKLPEEPFEQYSMVRRRCHAIGGILAETMARDAGFTFMVIGRMIERAIATCRTVRYLVLGQQHALDEGSVLRTVSSLQAYRRRPRSGGDTVSLAAFLLQADDVPRTVLSCLRRADGRLHRLRQGAPGLGPALMVCGRLRAQLEFQDLEQTLRAEPETFLAHVESELSTFSAAIANYAFDPAQLPSMQSQFVRPGHLA